jgi:hypothetical protein
MLERLPAWITSSTNRTEVLKAVARLRLLSTRSRRSAAMYSSSWSRWRRLYAHRFPPPAIRRGQRVQPGVHGGRRARSPLLDEPGSDPVGRHLPFQRAHRGVGTEPLGQGAQRCGVGPGGVEVGHSGEEPLDRLRALSQITMESGPHQAKAFTQDGIDAIADNHQVSAVNRARRGSTRNRTAMACADRACARSGSDVPQTPKITHGKAYSQQSASH